MIKANELRLGNLILNRHNEIDIVTDRTFQDFRYPKMDGDYGYRGITLTEEWFLKAGFDLIYYGYNGLIDIEIMLPWAGRKEIAYSVRINNEYSVGEPFKYVHQLQNLYFALTGEELVFSN